MTDQPAPHLDLDALADVLAGEGDRAHLDGCASCTSRLAELAAADRRVSSVLGALPAPPVPDGLGARLTAALDAEPPLAAAPRSGASVTALPSRSAGRRWLPAAAAAVLLVSGGGLGYALLQGPGSGGGDTAAGGAVADLAAPDVPRSDTGTDYADADAVRAVVPGVLGGSAGATTMLSENADEAQARTQDAPEPVAESGGTASGAQDPAAASSGDPLARLRTSEGLAGCLSALLPPEEPDLRPLALDYAQYAGQPALAVLLPDPDPDMISVFVVGPDCAPGNESLLQFQRVDAP